MMQRQALQAIKRSAPLGSSSRMMLQSRSIHSSFIRLQSSPKDGSTGVDPGYSTTKETIEQDRNEPEYAPKPSHYTDPFPLPFDPRLQGLSMSSEHQSDGLINGVEEPIPLRVPGREPGEETRENKVKRLIWQARKRGTLEADLLLATFAKKELSALNEEELDEFDRLLDEPDWDIFYWMTDRKPVVDRWKESFATEGRLGWRMRKHAKNEEKETRFMPNI